MARLNEQQRQFQVATDNLNRHTEDRERELIGYVEERLQVQIDRQTERRREVDAKARLAKREEESARKELEYLMNMLQAPKKI